MDMEGVEGSLVRTFLGVMYSGLNADWDKCDRSTDIQTYLSVSRSSSSALVVAKAHFLPLK